MRSVKESTLKWSWLQDSRAVAFDYWRSLFTEVSDWAGNGHLAPAGSGPLVAPMLRLDGRRMPVGEVLQMLQYERETDLELWELRLA